MGQGGAIGTGSPAIHFRIRETEANWRESMPNAIRVIVQDEH